jgi:nucleotide-binding universal stress UspA family protein
MAESIKLQSRDVQKKTSAKPGSKAVEARGELAVGYPAEEILRYADNNNIDLILIATHGRSGVKRWAVGSVADKVLSASKVPVWLVRADIPEEVVHDEWPKRTVLVPLDGSELAESVLPHVEALAKQRGAELVEVVLLRVCYPPEISSDYPEASMPLSWEEHVKHEMTWAQQGSEQYLADVQRRLKGSGLNVRSEVLMGKPADEIIKYVKDNNINLIVMATHGRSGLSRWAYGSTADKILRGATSPIFLVRPH